MKQLLIIGNLINGDDSINGQTLKTKNYISAFKEYGYEVGIFDTCGYSKRPLTKTLDLFFKIRKFKTIIMLPDINGMRFLSTFIPFAKKKKTQVYYSVVGGWLPSFVATHEKFIKRLNRLNGIFVENNNMKENLQFNGVQNVYIVNNFKIYKKNDENDINYESFCSKRHSFCFFSRIDVEKGTKEMIDAIEIVNKKGFNVHLDIYGPIFQEYRNDFLNSINRLKDNISYKGIGDPDLAPSIISSYYMQLFPTRCPTEGIPGSIIDSFAAGVPIISTLWNPKFPLVKNLINGLIVEMDSAEDIAEKIIYAIENPRTIYKMHQNCLNIFKLEYDYHLIMKKMIDIISEDEKGI